MHCLVCSRVAAGPICNSTQVTCCLSSVKGAWPVWMGNSESCVCNNHTSPKRRYINVHSLAGLLGHEECLNAGSVTLIRGKATTTCLHGTRGDAAAMEVIC